MTNLLILGLIVVLLLLYIFNKPKSAQISPEILGQKPEVIESSEHLKQEYANLQQKLRESFIEMGHLQTLVGQLSTEKSLLNANLSVLKAAFDKLQHQKKSSEVRTGAIGESLLPLHESFPVNPKTLRFLGAPIDYISFCYETNKITFVEVKTGESQLNENQRAVKKMVEEGKVEFKVVRLDEKGIKVK